MHNISYAMRWRIQDWNFNLLLVWSVNCICIYLKYIPSCTKWFHRNFLRQNQTIISNHISFEWVSSGQLKEDFTPMFRGRSVGLILSSVPGWSWPKHYEIYKTLWDLHYSTSPSRVASSIFGLLPSKGKTGSWRALATIRGGWKKELLLWDLE